MSATTYEVLIVEDNPGDVALMSELLPDQEFQLHHVETLTAAIETLSDRTRPFALVLLDLGLPDASGLEGVERISGGFPEVTLIVLTGMRSDELALRAIRSGAQDYLVKGNMDASQIARTLRHAVMRKKIEVHKNQFLSIISHEMRTPLNYILGFATALDDEVAGCLSHEQARMVRGIVEGADRLNLLVEDLLDAAQILAGRFSVSCQQGDFESLLTGAVAQMTPLAEKKQLALSIEQSSPAVLDFDERRLIQVLTNLIANAIKYTCPGGSIRVRSLQQGHDLRVEIIDNGIGIPDHFLPRLFNRFNQAPQTYRQQQKGTGLGLAISKAIIEAHGGEIGANSVQDGGSTFWFTLPMTAGRCRMSLLIPDPAREEAGYEGDMGPRVH